MDKTKEKQHEWLIEAINKYIRMIDVKHLELVLRFTRELVSPKQAKQ